VDRELPEEFPGAPILAAGRRNRNETGSVEGEVRPRGEKIRVGSGKIPMVTVLVVDDEALIRWSVTETLASAGFDVVEAGTAREALAAVSGRPGTIAVAVLDLKLPDSSDLGLLRRIRELSPACQVILMTANDAPEILDEALRAGAFGALRKPFDMQFIAGLVLEAAA
jgi:DNA-binding NtrC family response regulator